MKEPSCVFKLLLIVAAWPGASAAQMQSPVAVAAWGGNDSGQTTVPVEAQSGITAIAAGGSQTMALKKDGTIRAWGDNSTGQSKIPAGLVGVTATAAGEYHGVALRDDGSVVAWGANGAGQVTGNPATNYPYYATATPVTLGGQTLTGVSAIAAGAHHTVALRNDGSVVAWGANWAGQVTGNPATNYPYSAIATPVTLGGQALTGVRAIAARNNHTLALKNDGTVVAWGDNAFGQTNVPIAAQTGVIAVAAGSQHAVALRHDGTVVAWGYNDDGQATVPDGLKGVTAIAAGAHHTMALRDDGSVVAWGANGAGQVTGNPATNYPYSAIANPVTSGGKALTRVTAIAAGTFHSVVLVTPIPPTITTQSMSQVVDPWQSASFTVTAIGYPLYFQWRKDGVSLAGATSPTYNLSLAQPNQAGDYTVVVSNPAGSVTSTLPAVLTVHGSVVPGTVVAWGNNDHGQVTGTANEPHSANPGPVRLKGLVLSGVTAIAVGAHHTAALKNNGCVVTWGENSDDQITVPVSAQSGVTAIAAGLDYTVALKNDGTVVAWGDNTFGQVTGTPASAAPYTATVSPVTLAGQILSGVTAIAAGKSHAVALKNDGSIVAWGCNEYGQTTIPIAAQNGVTAIAAGSGYTMALKGDGSVVAWGLNEYGQVTGTTWSRTATASPVMLDGYILSGITSITVGDALSVALKNDGSVVTWGLVTTPLPLELDAVTAIAAESGCDHGYCYSHTIALKKDGSMVEWGDLVYGQTAAPAGLSGVTAIAMNGGHTVALIGAVPLRPTLNARSSGNQLVLSWSTNAVGFTLQENSNVTTTNWSDVPGTPTVNLTTGQNEVMLPPPLADKFYRLKGQ